MSSKAAKLPFRPERSVPSKYVELETRLRALGVLRGQRLFPVQEGEGGGTAPH